MYSNSLISNESQYAADQTSPISTPPLVIRKQLFTTPATPVSSVKKYNSKILHTQEPIKVFLRVRPFTTDETRRQEINCLEHTSDAVHVRHTKGDDLRFSFTSVFGPSINQEHFFRETALPLVDSFLQGHNGLLFAYGITNAGKTYTITGNQKDAKERGLLPRILDVVFNSIEAGKDSDMKGNEHTKFKMDQSSSFAVFISYAELYNDSLRDLLAVGNDSAPSTDDRGKRNITEVHVTSRSKAEDLLRQGMQARQVAATQLNNDSSRSHCMLTIKLVIYPKDTSLADIQLNPSLMKFCKLCVVDLAGSERGSRTGAVGQRIKEAGNINNSLLTLSRCLEALRWNQTHPNLKPQVVPFRDNKLTVFFKEYFTGSAKAVMVVNVNPSIKDCEETINVLKFAAVAKEITTTARLDTHRYGTRDAATPAGTLKKKRKVEEIKATENGPSCNELSLLKLELEQLREQLEEKIAWGETLEEQIREEAAEEMAAALFTMETQYRARLTSELESLEERYHHRLDIATRVTSALSEVYNQPEMHNIKQEPQHTQLVEELTSQLRAAEAKVQFLEEKVSNMSADREQDAAYLRARMDQELQEARVQLEANFRMEVYTLEFQIEQERKEKKCLEEEIVDLKARIAELIHLTTFNMAKDPKNNKTPSNLVKIAKYGIVEQTPPSVVEQTTTLWKGDVATSVTGDGVSVMFTEVNVISPMPTPQSPATRPADPLQTDGLVMQETQTNGNPTEWHNVTIDSPESKTSAPKSVKEHKKHNAQVPQSPQDLDSSIKAHKVFNNAGLLAMSKKLAHTLISPKKTPLLTSHCTLPNSSDSMFPKSPCSPKITSPKHMLSPITLEDARNKENTPPAEVKKSRRKLFDKSHDKEPAIEKEEKAATVKRKRGDQTPIAKRLRSRAK